MKTYFIQQHVKQQLSNTMYMYIFQAYHQESKQYTLPSKEFYLFIFYYTIITLICWNLSCDFASEEIKK